ncbi:MAG: protein kinase [Rubripirellula sp.]
MSENAQERAEDIFFDALELPPSERVAFISEQCGDDAKLRSRVEDLFAADAAAGAGNFLESQFLGGATLPPAPPKSDEPATENQEQRFRILSRYEQGGLGEVLIAHDRQLNREVAVKQIRPKWLEHNEARERFVQEAEITGRLEHPGIVPVYAMGKWEDGRPFYAMRFIRGTTLKKVIAEHRQAHDATDEHDRLLQLRSLLNRFVDVCNTIEYAHSRQILHRDIKPSNIMVGPYGETLVVDWGLAKLLDAPFDESMTAAFVAHNSDESGSSRTRIGGAVGTPQYMSPEQASGKIDGVGIWTDVYLLGATLYQILTGAPPHSEESVSKLIERVKQGILKKPSEVEPDVPPAMEAICLKAMSTSTFDRYSSAALLAADVERWLADEPVSVYQDPVSVRLGRWGRQHRTLAMSGAVAAILLTIGSVMGSTLWSYQRSRQFKVERERNLKETQLAASRQLRLIELKQSVNDALDLSLREISANRFSAALNILKSSGALLDEEPSLASEQEEIRARSQRITRIVDFYRFAELSEQCNVTSRDTHGILASTASLQALEVWDKPDWWSHLPDQDLMPNQRDQLRWDVYQQWLMLDGMLVKTIGTRLFGPSKSGGTARLLPALRRMRSSTGKSEATAALVVSDRIDWFRQSEATRWYRGIAHFRLGSGNRLKGSELQTARNAQDAQKLGVLCMISAMDPTFNVVFRDYKNQDAISAGRDLFQRSASLRPDHYWTQLALAQMQYFIADQESNPTWKSYQPAVQTMGRCIAINPESCFAFADRSSLFRFQSERMKLDTDLPESERKERASELLKWSLQDAQTAYGLGRDQPWVGWTYGMALSAAEQTDQAVDVFLEASLRTHPLTEVSDATLIRADDLRGRSAAVELAKELIDREPDNSMFRTLLASILLNQQKYDEALEQVEEALKQSAAPAHAFAIRGMIHLQQENFEEAAKHFRDAIDADPDHVWAAYGAASCDDAKGLHALALRGFQRALELSMTDEHRAACLLGMGRSAGFLGDFADAMQNVSSAQSMQPACDIASVAIPLVAQFKKLRDESKDQTELVPMQGFLKSLADLMRSTKIEFEEPTGNQTWKAPILNGDFELGSMRYWSDELGVVWKNAAGYAGTAQVSGTETHLGNSSLHIAGKALGLPDQRGSTSQEIPIPENSTCKLSVWAKADQLEAGAIRIQAGDRGMIKIKAGTYDWRQFEVEFEVGDSPDPTLTVVPLKLTLTSAGAGDVYLDDLELKVAPN